MEVQTLKESKFQIIVLDFAFSRPTSNINIGGKCSNIDVEVSDKLKGRRLSRNYIVG